MANKQKKVLIAVNTLTSVNNWPYASHLNLMYRLGRDHRNIDFQLMSGVRTSIDRFRNMAAKYCISNEFDYLFFIDDDMIIPKDAFTKLYQANYDIIMGHVYIRSYPFEIMAFKFVKFTNGVQNKRLVNITQEDLSYTLSNGVLKVDAIGTAVSLIKVKVLKQIEKPWFLTGPHQTEDIYFCMKALDNIKHLKIGLHTQVKCGHLLDPEVISEETREAHIKYIESFFSKEQIIAINESKGDRGESYINENILPKFKEMA